ncbi:MAG: histidine kinase [Bacteroidetes bacterium]|nr:histidine kinase [Bacteroidota bacterium]
MRLLLFFVIFFFPVLAFSQDFNYVHYDTKDGLAGSTVYSMCQDKDGYMWFATDNGLTRFDGTNFKNFTVKDGLPDNEVLKVFADSKGRVWIGTFSKDICYYYRNRIYNKFNSELVKKINPDATLANIAEDSNGFVAISTYFKGVILTANDSIIEYNFDKLYNRNLRFASIQSIKGKLYMTNEYTELMKFDNDSLKWTKTIVPDIIKIDENYKNKLDSFRVRIKYDSINHWHYSIKFPGNPLSVRTNGNYSFAKYISTTDGCWEIDSIQGIPKYHFLVGKRVGFTLEDDEKNLWFSTFGDGVYKLPSTTVKTISFKNISKAPNDEVFSLAADKKEIIVGALTSIVFSVDNNFVIKPIYSDKKIESSLLSQTDANRLYSIKKFSSEITILGFDKFLAKLEGGKYSIKYIHPIKSIDKIDSENILAGTATYVFKIRVADMAITDTLWKDRSTKVFCYKRHNYVGTLNGLYEIHEDKTTTFLGNLHPVLTRRITDIKAAADGTLWIATSDNGVIGIKDNKVVKLLNDTTGLSSNICKTLFIDGYNLWVGTDKGINKVDIGYGKYAVIKYASTDGLPSNSINAILVKDSLVWVGTPAGLTYFKENSISDHSMCNLKLEAIHVSGRQISMDSAIHLSYQDNNIKFEYAGISFRSGGEITYHYKLTGLDADWKTTTENYLDYKSLPAEDYELELYAVNKYGVRSKTISVAFSIAAPFWRTLWFYILMCALAIVLVIVILNRRNKIVRRHLEEKNKQNKQFAELEQQALQAQMNPHFIFNCLNAIQQYIVTNNTEKANEYLTGFAALIRQTLDNSQEKNISVAEEVQYLTRYLEMEQMRFGDKFRFSITVGQNIQADFVEIPAMLLQPYVENSLRHGIRYIADTSGFIAIHFTLDKSILHISIRDNGVGRARAAELKSKTHIEYQSKGMGLTAKRIELINKMRDSAISVTIKDLTNENGAAAGTEVELKIPV